MNNHILSFAGFQVRVSEEFARFPMSLGSYTFTCSIIRRYPFESCSYMQLLAVKELVSLEAFAIRHHSEEAGYKQKLQNPNGEVGLLPPCCSCVASR